MNKIKDSFLIQDLEALSGIKAHTIRIWEKRYAILSPTRLNRNIRKYSLSDLQKLLNISVLYTHKFKISKLSKLSLEELQETAREVALASVESNYHVNSLIVAMYSFDTLTFEKVYSELIAKMKFEDLFAQVYIPLLNHIGVLWQTNAIQPAHEHFISNLIVAKVTLHTASIELSILDKEQTYVLFLPEGEMHSLGLLYLNYCLRVRGKHTVFLGGGIPLSNLEVLSANFSNIHWICSFVIDRAQEEKELFLNEFAEFLKRTESEAMVIGAIWEGVEIPQSSSVKMYSSYSKLPFFS